MEVQGSARDDCLAKLRFTQVLPHIEVSVRPLKNVKNVRCTNSTAAFSVARRDMSISLHEQNE